MAVTPAAGADGGAGDDDAKSVGGASTDSRAALEVGASDAQVEALLAGWGVQGPRGASRADKIQQAVAALDSALTLRRLRGRGGRGLGFGANG